MRYRPFNKLSGPAGLRASFPAGYGVLGPGGNLLSQALAAWFPHSSLATNGQVIPEYGGSTLDMLNGGTSAPTTNDAEFLPYDPSVGGYAAFNGVGGNSITLTSAVVLDNNSPWSLKVRGVWDDSVDDPASILGSSVTLRNMLRVRKLSGLIDILLGPSFIDGQDSWRNVDAGLVSGQYYELLISWDGVDTLSLSNLGVSIGSKVLTSPAATGQFDLIGHRGDLTNTYAGKIYEIYVPSQARFDASLATQSGYTDPVSGKTWMPSGEVPIVNSQSGSVHRGNGSNQFLGVAESSVPAVAEGAEKTIVLRCSYFASGISGGRWLASDNDTVGFAIRPPNTDPRHDGFVRADTIAFFGSPTSRPKQYTQVALVFTATHVVEYIDGIEASRVARPSGTLPDSAFRVFRDMASNPYQKGLFAGCAFFDRALSPSELIQLNGEMRRANGGA